MQWRKPADMRYTELCIFIDQNIAKIVNPGENPELENKIYNYNDLLDVNVEIYVNNKTLNLIK